MNKRTNIENRLSRKFQNYAPQVDESEMWSAIDQALDNKPTRKRGLFWLLLLVPIMVMGIAYSYGLFQNKDSAEVVSAESVAIGSNDENSNAKEIADSKTQRKEMVAVDEQLAIKTMKEKGKPSTQNLKEDTPVIAETNRVAKPSQFKSRLSTSTLSGKNTEATGFTIDKTNNVQKTGMAKEGQVKMPVASLGILTNVPVISICELSLSVNPTLPILNLETTLPIRLEISPIKRWSMDLGIGVGGIKPRYEASDSEDTGLLDLRRANESVYQSLNGDASVFYAINKRWAIGLGLAYTHMTTGSLVRSSSVSTVSLTDTVAVYNNVSGTTVETVELEYMSTTKQLHQRYTRIQQLHIPFQVRYSNNIAGRWGYQISAGYTYGIWSQVTGIEQDLLDQSYDLSTDTENRLMSTASNKLSLGAQATYRHKNLEQIYFGLQYVSDLRGVYNDNNNIQKKLHLLQCKAGVIIPLKF